MSALSKGRAEKMAWNQLGEWLGCEGSKQSKSPPSLRPELCELTPRFALEQQCTEMWLWSVLTFHKFGFPVCTLVSSQVPLPSNKAVLDSHIGRQFWRFIASLSTCPDPHCRATQHSDCVHTVLVLKHFQVSNERVLFVLQGSDRGQFLWEGMRIRHIFNQSPSLKTS